MDGCSPAAGAGPVRRLRPFPHAARHAESNGSRALCIPTRRGIKVLNKGADMALQRYAAVVPFFCFAATCLGQTQTATVHGIVSDRTGAVIPNTTIVLTNVDQNRSWRSS